VPQLGRYCGSQRQRAVESGWPNSVDRRHGIEDPWRCPAGGADRASNQSVKGAIRTARPIVGAREECEFCWAGAEDFPRSLRSFKLALGRLLATSYLRISNQVRSGKRPYGPPWSKSRTNGWGKGLIAVTVRSPLFSSRVLIPPAPPWMKPRWLEMLSCILSSVL
jgi:hypothetical protein